MLQNIWQLRWQLLTDYSSGGIYPPSQIALMALKCLRCIVCAHKSVDSRGVPFFPIPIAKQLICEQSYGAHYLSNETHVSNLNNHSLAMICQALLCSDERMVEAAINCIMIIMDHNERACTKLYLTGIFFFALIYTGPNFEQIARLIDTMHTKQNFNPMNDIHIKDQSILSNIFPEGLLKVLVNHGAKKFGDVFLGNYDTPEGEFITV
jgi:DnaJ family protein C protein 13